MNIMYIVIGGLFVIGALSWIRAMLSDWHTRVIGEKKLEIERLEAELELEQVRQHTLKETPRYRRPDE